MGVTLLSIILALGALAAHADTFGSGANQFTIDFVGVGNAGNANDAGAGGGIYSSPYGGVAYNYRIATYEISQDMITKAANLGMANVTAGPWTGNQPAASMSWYEVAAFVNWLNTSKGYSPAYNLTWNGSSWGFSLWGVSDQASTGVNSGTNPYRHKNAFYFLPSEDEWLAGIIPRTSNACTAVAIGGAPRSTCAPRAASTTTRFSTTTSSGFAWPALSLNPPPLPCSALARSRW